MTKKEIQAKLDAVMKALGSNRGWVCPVCGAGLAPSVTRCPCVPIATRSWPVTPDPPHPNPLGPTIVMYGVFG